jgi:hypothetical protein
MHHEYIACALVAIQERGRQRYIAPGPRFDFLLQPAVEHETGWNYAHQQRRCEQRQERCLKRNRVCAFW